MSGMAKRVKTEHGSSAGGAGNGGGSGPEEKISITFGRLRYDWNGTIDGPGGYKVTIKNKTAGDHSGTIVNGTLGPDTYIEMHMDCAGEYTIEVMRANGSTATKTRGVDGDTCITARGLGRKRATEKTDVDGKVTKFSAGATDADDANRLIHDAKLVCAEALDEFKAARRKLAVAAKEEWAKRPKPDRKKPTRTVHVSVRDGESVSYTAEPGESVEFVGRIPGINGLVMSGGTLTVTSDDNGGAVSIRGGSSVSIDSCRGGVISFK